MEVILLERIEKLGQMGDVVSVKAGYARNFLLPGKKALRATEENRKHFEVQRAQLEAANLEQRGEAEKVAAKMEGLSVILVRQAGEAGQLYGSVNARDIAAEISDAGFTVSRQQVDLAHPIKAVGLFDIAVSLHPEISVAVTVNVARSADEAKTQAKTGKAVTGTEEEDDERAAHKAAVEAADEVFEKHEDAETAVDEVEELVAEESTEETPAAETATEEAAPEEEKADG